MKIYTSYFYQIRFFKPHQIPISTAMWDPKWFHDFKDHNHIWKDKNGVWNGIRLEILNPGSCCITQPPECVACIDEKRERTPKTCKFIKEYKEGLEKINFQSLIEILIKTADYFQQLEGFTDEPEIILIVHEAPNNPCSERIPLQELFKEHGINVIEWERNR